MSATALAYITKRQPLIGGPLIDCIFISDVCKEYIDVLGTFLNFEMLHERHMISCTFLRSVVCMIGAFRRKVLML